VATDRCIVFDEHIRLRCVKNEAPTRIFQHRVPSQVVAWWWHGGGVVVAWWWRRVSVQTDHTWDKLVLPIMVSTKVCQLFSLVHLVRLRTSRQASNHCSLFLLIVHPQRLRLFMAAFSAGVIQHCPESKTRTIPTLFLAASSIASPKKVTLFFRDDLKSQGLM
jgi:hypothetical protein